MPASVNTQINHLKKDKILRETILSIGKIERAMETDLYLTLLRSIAGQQLSTKAAQTIWNRFVSLFENSYPAPQVLLNMNDQLLREAGLSFQKIGYLKNIAEFELSRPLQSLSSLEDEALIQELTSIKGVGRWTVEMILMFSLGREDVFPVGDLGIQNGMISMYKLRTKDKKSLFVKMQRIAEAWKPYRTLACFYIWKYKDAQQK